MAERHGSHAIDAHAAQPVVRHETSDANVTGVFVFAASLAFGTVFVGFLVWLLYGYFDAHRTRTTAPQFPLAAAQAARLPPEPRLQTAPRQELQELRAKEDEVLRTYGWVDKNAGVVRIPIEEAMKLTLERGLPARQPTGEKR
jgi:hypothetical protein